MKYTDSDYIFLGKQVAAGKYVRYTTFLLSIVIALAAGVLADRHLLPSSAVSLPSGSISGQGGQGQVEASSGASPAQLEAAIASHEEELRADPDNAETWVHLGNLYYQARKPEKAIEAYEKSLSLNPGDTGVLVDCGVMYRELGKYDRALEYFNKALQADPTHQFALFNSGVVLYYDLGNTDAALEKWREMVRLNPQAKTPMGGLVSDLIKSIDAGKS